MEELFVPEAEAREERNRVVGGTLYLVGTPIGNMADLSPRAVKVLSEVDFIAAEDTRRTGRLLASIGASRPMVSCYKDNERASAGRILSRLLEGESCALVTDAGMPAISDPGETLVKMCAEAGVTVTSVPGPSAAVTALALSGADTRSFTFMGFLPQDGKQRREALDELSTARRTYVIYEAPHRLTQTLDELIDACGGDRKLAICRELTKLNEQIIRTTLSDAAALFAETAPRGEFVLVLHGRRGGDDWSALTVREHVAMYEESGMARMEAMKAAARDRGVGKSDIYRELQK